MTSKLRGNAGKGRPKGSKNKTQPEVRALAAQFGPAAVKKLAAIAMNDEHKDQVTAIRDLLDRAYGKPPQQVTHDTDGPIELRIFWGNG